MSSRLGDAFASSYEGASSWLRAAAHLSRISVAAPASPLLEGTVLFDRFVVTDCVGQGGMGRVYAAEDRSLGTRVALKTVLDPGQVLHLKREFRSLATLRHPNVVELFDLFAEGDLCFFTMELVDGVDFVRFVRPGGALDELRLRASLGQLASAIEALHAARKIHRDIKPSNTLVEATGRLVLLDLGLVAAPLEAGDIVGTPAYVAPEQAGGSPASAPADWYGVGVVLYQALHGTLPFSGTRREILEGKLTSSPKASQMEGPPDLRALCAALLERDPSKRAAGSDVRDCLRERGSAADSSSRGLHLPAEKSTPFVGRHAELSELRRALDDAVTDGPVALLVRGDPGVGKTELLARFRDEIVARATVLSGRCYEQAFVPYRALDEIVDALAVTIRHGPELLPRISTPEVAIAGQLFPVLGGHLPPPAQSPAISDRHERRRRGVEGLRQILQHLAAHRPLVVMVDDLQWGDPDSFALLRELLHVGARAPVLWVLAARSDWPEGTLSFPLRPLRIGSLDPEAAIQLGHALAGEASRDRAEGLARASRGHPLFLAELARAWAAPEGSPTSVPATVEDALGRHLDRLSANARRLLDLTALSGEPLAPSVLALASALPPPAFTRELRELRAERLLRTHAAGGGLLPYHDLLRAAALRRLDPGEQKSGHAALAGAIEALEPGRFEALARHNVAASRRAEGARYAVLAGRQAEAALAFERAAELYAMALDSGATDPLVTESRARALANAGRWSDASESFLRAARSATGEPRFHLERHAAENLLRAGRVVDALDLVDRILPKVGLSRPRTLPGLLARLGLEFLQLETMSRRAGAGAHQRMTGGHVALDTCRALASGLAAIDYIAAGTFGLRYVRLALGSGNPEHTALAMGYVALSKAASGPPAREARALLARARTAASGLEHPLLHARLTLSEAGIAYQCLQFGELEHLASEVVARLEAEGVGIAPELAMAQRLHLESLWYTGRFAQMTAEAQILRRAAEERDDRLALTQLKTSVFPFVHLVAGRPQAARDDLESAMEGWPRDEFWLPHWQYRLSSAVVDMYEGDYARLRVWKSRSPPRRECWRPHPCSSGSPSRPCVPRRLSASRRPPRATAAPSREHAASSSALRGNRQWKRSRRWPRRSSPSFPGTRRARSRTCAGSRVRECSETVSSSRKRRRTSTAG